MSSDRWTDQDFAEYQARHPRLRMEIVSVEPKPNKYHAKKTEVDGIGFDSKKEADRYGQLKLMEAGGAVKDIRTQVRYRLEINGIKICDYIADFVYFDKFSRPGADPWKQIVEDSKGIRTPVYRLKKKLMLALHGIEIRET